jgi:hypothetical protein
MNYCARKNSAFRWKKSLSSSAPQFPVPGLAFAVRGFAAQEATLLKPATKSPEMLAAVAPEPASA